MTAPSRLGVLVDGAADDELAATGYVVVPFLDDDLVAELAAAALTVPHREQGLVIDFADPDREVMRRTADVLRPMWAAHLDELFTDHRVVVSTFVTKHPGTDSAMAMHREPTFVRGEARTFNAWIPLVDVDRGSANGVLWLVPGSEHLPQGLVGFNTPPLFRSYDRTMREHAVTLDVRAGSALVYDTRMLHWSDANESDAPRPAIAAAIAPAGEQLIHAVASGRRHRRIHLVDPAFFVEHHPAAPTEDLATRWPVSEDVDEAPSLTPAAVAAALRLDPRDVAHASSVVPGDLADGAARRELIGVTVPGAVLPTEDVGDRALPEGASLLPWGGEVVVHGDAGFAALSDVQADPSSPSFTAGLASLVPAGSSAVVLRIGPGARVALSAPSDRPLAIAALDVAEMRGGVLLAEAVGTFTPGTVHAVPAGCEATCWNDGPGPAWLVASVPVDGVRRRGLLARLGAARRSRAPAGAGGTPAAPIG